MSKNVSMAIFFVLMVASIVVPDLVFLSKDVIARLIWNVSVVAAFAAIYFVLLKRT